MAYDPGTLLTVKPDVLKSKIELFKTYSECPWFSWHLTNDPRYYFQPGDNIFIVDYYAVDRGYRPDSIWYGWKDWFYRVWVNGKEAKLQHCVLEIEEYYEVVK